MPEAEQVWQFTEGLKTGVRVYVNLQNPKTMEEAFEVADTTDNSLFSGRKDREISPYRAADRRGESRSNPIVLNKLEEQRNDEEQSLHVNFIKDELASSWQRRDERANKAKKAAERRPIVCWTCGKEGHRASECRSQSRQPKAVMQKKKVSFKKLAKKRQEN